jgi:hypothetical protein
MAIKNLPHPLQEPFQVDDKPFVPALADLLVFVKGLHLEHQAAAIDLDQLGGGAHLLADGRRRQVGHMHQRAYRHVALVQPLRNGPPGRVLHQRNHHRRTENLHAARADGCRRIFMHNRRLRLPRHACLERHVYVPFHRGVMKNSEFYYTT